MEINNITIASIDFVIFQKPSNYLSLSGNHKQQAKDLASIIDVNR